MDENKKKPVELTDDEVDEAAGGKGATKPCATPGCPNTLDANSRLKYCAKCRGVTMMPDPR